MKNLGKIVLHIPARGGSKRVPHKNLRLMNGKSMISYSIEASIKANVTNNIYINTDSDEIKDYVNAFYPKCKVYERDKYLADDKTTSDQFNYDIINNLQPDTLIMINPVCPLIESSDIKGVLNRFISSECDTLITANSTHMQTFCEGQPINIYINEQLAPSQENKLVTTLNWAITIWETKSFKRRMIQQGFAVLGENREFFELDPFKSVKVSEEKDFVFAERILKQKIKS